MSSPNNHEQWSPSGRRRRSLERRRQQLGTICTDAVRNALPSIGQQLTTARSIQVTNQFQQLQVQHETSRASTQPVTRADRAAIVVNRLENESLAEDQLIEELKELINQFMQRPGRQLNYNNTIRWTVDPGNDQDYSVVILINQPSALI
jgi:hypothetical protein